MLRRKQFLGPVIVLGAAMMMTYWFPHLVTLWALLFLLVAGFLFVVALASSFLWMDRLYRKKLYDRLIAFCQPIWQRGRNKTSKNVAGLYLAAAFIARGQSAQFKKAAAIIDQVDSEKLVPRFRNRFFLVRSQLAFYQDRYEEGMHWLKQCSLQPSGLFYLARMFYFFSLGFMLTNQEAKRSYNYAAKAFELFPDEAIYQAQVGLCLHNMQSGSEGMLLLQEAVDKISAEDNSWEKQFYTAALDQLA